MVAHPSRKLLLIEDDEALAQSMAQMLEEEGFQVTWVGDGDQGIAEAVSKDGEFATVITDFRLPRKGGMEVLKSIREGKPHLPIVLITAHGTANLAIKAIQQGAFDYLTKPFRFHELLEVVERAVHTSWLTGKRVEVGTMEDEGADKMIGDSRPMQEVYKQLGRLANKGVTVLIRGETGTGKELIARALWQYSSRKDGPFIAVNCSAIPDSLLESELFGHERGAFTGAHHQRIGRFEQANHGTLFLDEIGDMPVQTQVKLLRVLQERVIQRVGGREDIPIDVRIIAATHSNLEKLIEEGRFREDLYFRLNSAEIRLPPLRERTEDIRLLAEYFLLRDAEAFRLERNPVVEERAFQRLTEHTWPGNVRELENLIKRALLASQGYPISAQLIGEFLQEAQLGSATSASTWEDRVREVLIQADRDEVKQGFQVLLEEFECSTIAETMRFAESNQSRAARLLGISRVTLREKLDRYELFPKRRKGK